MNSLEIRIGPYRADAYSAENPRYTSRILLVHGLWTGAWCWGHWGSFLAHRGWEVIAPDLSGRPGSRSARLEEVTFEDYVTDLVELISREAESPPVVVGHDLGGLVAIAASNRASCRAVVALAPLVRSAFTTACNRVLRRSVGWFHRDVARPPTAFEEPELDWKRFRPDSGRVVRSLLRGEPVLERTGAPTLIVASEQDPLLDSKRLEAQARTLGAAFATRDAGHWGFQATGFERHVDLFHRWLVREIGDSLLKLTGFEDVADEPTED